MRQGRTIEAPQVDRQIHYRTLLKAKWGEIREYPPLQRVIFEYHQEVRAYFPYTILAWNHVANRPHVAFAKRPVRTWFSPIYYPSSLIAHGGGFSVCTGNFEYYGLKLGSCSEALDSWVDFFWRSDFGRQNCSTKHLEKTHLAMSRKYKSRFLWFHFATALPPKKPFYFNRIPKYK
jgi:hypothetical protein